MSIEDELNDALRERKRAEKMSADGRQRIVEDRERFEQEEREAKSELREAADMTLQALVAGAPVTRLPIGPKRLLRGRQHAEGWKVSLGERRPMVLCPDGVLKEDLSSSPGARRGPELTLGEWIDAEVDRVRLNRGQSSHRHLTSFEEAFEEPTDAASPRDARSWLREHLRIVRKSVLRTLAGWLQEHGLPAAASRTDA